MRRCLLLCRFLVLLVCASLIAVGLAGCDSTEELARSKAMPAGRLAASNGAGRLLEQVSAAYQRLKSYEDSGRVVLTYRVDGQATQDVAPLAVAFERPNRLGLKAYQVTAGMTDNRFRMRLTTDAISPVRSQVASRGLPKNLDVEWIMRDTLAREHLAAGLAGAPPQLELLLSEQPFQALLDDSAIVTLDGQGAERGRTFHIVKIARGRALYRFWIDADTSLLRRIELPTATLPPAMLADTRISGIRLSVELDDVRANAPVDWSQWRVATASLDQMVRYFVMPTAMPLDPRLGKAVPAFRLNSLDKAVGMVDTSQIALKQQIPLLVWLADHPSCRTTLQQINHALAALSPDIRKQISPVAVWAAPQPAAGTTFATLANQWEMAMPLVVDSEALGRDVLSVQEAPTIVLLDRKHRLQFFQERADPHLQQALPEMLERLVRGESLAETMIEKAERLRAHDDAQLWLARSSDASVGAFVKPRPYSPMIVQLEKLETLPSESSIAALYADPLHNLWICKQDGQLECRDHLGKSLADYATEVISRDDQALRLAIDEQARYVAICDFFDRSPTGLTSLNILDTRTSRTSSIGLGHDQKPVDVRWLSTPAGVRLAAICRSGRTILIDPTTSPPMSGQSPAEPLALLERFNEDSLSSGYVILDDGRIEPVIVEAQAGVTQAALSTSVLASSSVASSRPAASSTHSTSTASSDKTSSGTASSGTASNRAAKQSSVGKTASTVARAGSGLTTAVSPFVQRQLKFTPAAGPWCTWNESPNPRQPSTASHDSSTLARGWIESDEPAVYLLDHQLGQRWHAPLPIADRSAGFLTSVAKDPTNGQPLWVVAQTNTTLHFFRNDGSLVDHCQFDEPVRGVALLPNGSELHLWVAHPHSIVRYRVR